MSRRSRGMNASMLVGKRMFAGLSTVLIPWANKESLSALLLPFLLAVSGRPAHTSRPWSIELPVVSIDCAERRRGFWLVVSTHHDVLLEAAGGGLPCTAVARVVVVVEIEIGGLDSEREAGSVSAGFVGRDN